MKLKLITAALAVLSLMATGTMQAQISQSGTKEVKVAPRQTSTAAKKELPAASAKGQATAQQAKAKNDGKKPADGRTKTGDKIDHSMKGPKGERVYTGERGGKYYLDKNDKRIYITNK